MSKPVKILLLLATLWPLIYMGLFLIVFVMLFTFSVQGEFQGGNGPPAGFLLIFVLHIFTMVWMVGLLVFYIINVFKTRVIRDNMKILWAIVIFFGGPIAMPIYWYLYIWKEPEIIEATEKTTN